MAYIDDVGKNTAKKIENTTAQQASSAASNAAHNLASSSGSDTNKNMRQKYRVSPGKEASINTINRSSNNTGDLSSDEEKELKKQRDIEYNAEALDTVADVAANSRNGVAKFFGNAHKVLAKNEGYRNAAANAARVANKLAPGAQSMVNKAVESGAADKVADAVSAKNGEADKAGEKKLDDSTKKEVKKAAKEAGDKGKSEHSVETEGMVIIKNPLTWIILAFAIVMTCLMMVLIPLLHTSTGKRGGTCEFPYVEMDYYDKIIVKDGDQFFTVDLEDYVPGVIAHEVGGFEDSPEMLKVQAIAARTYAQYMMRYQGYVINSAVNQTYDPDEKYTTPGNPIYDASQATAGLVLIRYDENDTPRFIMSEYDALAIDESCGGKEDTANNYVIICQGKIKVPIDWLKARMIESDYNFFKKYFHGRGMSQWGGYYLTKEQGYDYKQVLNLFYDDAQIVSLYPNPLCDCNVSLEITESPDSATQLDMNIDDFFKSKGTSLKAVNDELLQQVLKAGPGTRCGVVTAALFTVNKLLEYDARLPYYWGGGSGGYGDCSASSTYGFCPGWGTYNTRYGGTSGSIEYPYTGIDCGRYVTWIFLNGGVSIYDGEHGADYGSGQFTNKPHTTNYDPYSSEYTGQPGDVIVCSGGNHAELILSGDGSGYYIAHASGRDSGIKVNYVSYDSLSNSSCEIVDMTWYYENQKIEDFENVYNSGRGA